MSIPAQVVYTTSQPSGSLPQQERLPSIRDLDFHYPGQGNTGRPSRQQPPQVEQAPNPSAGHNVRARQPPASWNAANPSQPPVAQSSMPPPHSASSQDYHHHASQPVPPSSTGSSLSRHETYGGHGVPSISSGHAPIHRHDTGSSMQPPQKRLRSESIQSPSIPHVSGGRSSQHAYSYPPQSASPYSTVSIPPPPHSASSSISSQSLPPSAHPYAQHTEYSNYSSGYPAQHTAAHRQSQMSPPSSGVYSSETWQHHQQSSPHHVQHTNHPPPQQMSSVQQTPMHPPPQAHTHQPHPPPMTVQHSQQPPPSSQQPPPHASHYSQHQPPPPPPSAHSAPPHAQQPPQPPQSTQQQPAPSLSASASYIRTTPIVPTPVAAAGGGQVAKDADESIKQSLIPKIQEYCHALYNFANRYALLQQSQPQARPSESEIAEMAERAALVVKLLEEVRRRLTMPEGADDDPNAHPYPLQPEGRAPKRPWEDMSNDDASFTQGASLSPADKMQSMAEKDMAIIRSKRATNTGAVNAGIPKGKYRKRSRANPPGKCHSCNIRETPEWRRGPDGARTLCNACGLHYAKLVRKRDKQLGADGQPVRIDLETLRASTRAAGDKENSQQPTQKSGNDTPPSSHPNPHSQPHTPSAQSMSASPTVATSKTPSHPAHARPPPTSAASSAPYSYSPLSSASQGTGSIHPPPSALSGGHVEHMNSGTTVWTNHTPRNYGGEQSFLRPSHAPAEPRSTSA